MILSRHFSLAAKKIFSEKKTNKWINEWINEINE